MKSGCRTRPAADATTDLESQSPARPRLFNPRPKALDSPSRENGGYGEILLIFIVIIVIIL